MSDSETLARLHQHAARRAPGNDDTSRRIATLCGLTQGSRVLDLGCGTGPTARLLARELGCEVTCVDVDACALDTLVAAAKRESVAERIRPVKADIRELQLPQGDFDAALVEGSLRFFAVPFVDAVRKVRRFLLPGLGKLAVTVPARVGRALPASVAAFYEERGEPLGYPRELTLGLESAGFEPLVAEALDDAIVDGHYRLLEDALAQIGSGGAASSAAALRREIDIYRREGGRAAVDVVLLVARRKEAGERPPASRGRG